jgi:selenide, water dikinase
MLDASGLAARLDLASLPTLPGALELLRLGLRSTFHPENERFRAALSIPPGIEQDPRIELLFDPQTAGGLLFGLPADRAAEALRRLQVEGSPKAVTIGETRSRAAGDHPIDLLSGR